MSRTCALCGSLLVGRQKLYCSTECRQQAPPKKPPRPRRCIDCSTPITSRATRCGSCRNRTRLGNRNPVWKGDEASRKAGHHRAQKAFGLGTCEWNDCQAPAVDRHHVDGNTLNNNPANIQRLCRRHHMETDGRLTSNLVQYRNKAA